MSSACSSPSISPPTARANSTCPSPSQAATFVQRKGASKPLVVNLDAESLPWPPKASFSLASAPVVPLGLALLLGAAALVGSQLPALLPPTRPAGISAKTSSPPSSSSSSSSSSSFSSFSPGPPVSEEASPLGSFGKTSTSALGKIGAAAAHLSARSAAEELQECLALVSSGGGRRPAQSVLANRLGRRLQETPGRAAFLARCASLVLLPVVATQMHSGSTAQMNSGNMSDALRHTSLLWGGVRIEVFIALFAAIIFLTGVLAYLIPTYKRVEKIRRKHDRDNKNSGEIKGNESSIMWVWDDSD
eukprot:GHVT01013414.1.p1 GENE.GHVT01013414.1~~GHVT01013414.1.p1  ORF type:complete len:304 (+),score=88.68 GHVT01013414.1:233-1144(+)